MLVLTIDDASPHVDVASRSGPVQAWGEKSSGAVTPPDRPAVTLELDLHVMSFIRKIHKHEVRVENTYIRCFFIYECHSKIYKHDALCREFRYVL